ncbi:MAG: hypothetical protein PHU59_05695 [Candidatus Omnitrophica bacterium]|nr:hypothetical protein [Candidatus Omnitrophota bacterium]
MKNKKKINVFYRLTHLVTYHPWIKIISLALAIIVWFYVRGENY